MRLRVVAVLCCAAVLCLALVGCGGLDKSIYTGEWKYSSSENADLDEQSMKLAESLGLEIKLWLNEDGTGTFTMLSDSKNVKWEAKNETEGKLSIEGSGEVSMTLSESGELSLTDSEKGVLKFKRP